MKTSIVFGIGLALVVVIMLIQAVRTVECNDVCEEKGLIYWEAGYDFCRCLDGEIKVVKDGV